MKLTEDEYQALLQRPAIARRNQVDSEASSAKPEQAIRNEPLAAQAGEGSYSRRFVVRITSFRLRLLDPDDLCPKYFVDGCRYAGLISGDSEAQIDYERPRQVKVFSKSEERTEIVIEALPD